MKAWYLIYSKLRKEFVAKEQLELKGFEVYLPMIGEQTIKSDHPKMTYNPMFPRYFFIHLCDKTDDWRTIGYTIGVANIVSFSLYPMRVPDDLINSLKVYEDKQSCSISTNLEFELGDKVRVLDDTPNFGGFEAIIRAKSANDRVRLLLTISQSNLEVTLRKSEIEKIT